MVGSNASEIYLVLCLKTSSHLLCRGGGMRVGVSTVGAHCSDHNCYCVTNICYCVTNMSGKWGGRGKRQSSRCSEVGRLEESSHQKPHKPGLEKKENLNQFLSNKTEHQPGPDHLRARSACLRPVNTQRSVPPSNLTFPLVTILWFPKDYFLFLFGYSNLLS